MPIDFEKLEAERSALLTLSKTGSANGFFAQEALRFLSIAGTLLAAGSFQLDEGSSVDERYLTHVLTRSLIENWFTIIYLFDDPAKTLTRYEALKNTFRGEYRKMFNEPQLPHKDKLEPADPTWVNLPGLPNVNDMLVNVRNVHGDRLNYLYFVYRITSFDTHGRSLGNLTEAVFGKQVNFPVLKIKRVFDYIANEYLVILSNLRSSGMI
jgi:hypothetical protein